MRLLYLNHNLYERGTFFRAFHFARHAVKRGHDVELWTSSAEVCPLGKRFVRDGVVIWRPPRLIGPKRHDGGYAPLDIVSRLLASRSIHPGEFDVIHAFDHRPNVSLPWYLLRQARGTSRRPLMAADWCDWWTRGGITTSRRSSPRIDAMEACLEEGSKRHADLVTTISTVLRDRAVSVGVRPEDVSVVPSGCDVDSIQVEDSLRCRWPLGWTEMDPLVCFVGLSLWDLDMVAEAMLALRESHPNAGLLVVGGGVEAEAIQRLSERLNGEGLILPGQVPYSEISGYLGAADVHLLPLQDNLANRARIPNKLGDCMASGRPVVTARVGDTGRFVTETGIGIATTVEGAAMGEAVGRLLDDDDLRLGMGRRAREIAETERSWAAMADRMLELYERRCVC